MAQQPSILYPSSFSRKNLKKTPASTISLGPTQTGACAYLHQNQKPTQEDAIAYSPIVREWNFLTSLEQKELIKETFQEMQKTCGRLLNSKNQPHGSTALITIISPVADNNTINITIANVGDSRAFLCRRDKSTGQVESVSRLNETLDDCYNPDEVTRVIKEDGKVHPLIKQDEHGKSFYPNNIPRLNGGLSVSRDIGFQNLPQGGRLNEKMFRGLKHEPTIYPHEITLTDEENIETFIILASDGLTEPVKKPSLSQDNKENFNRLEKEADENYLKDLLSHEDIASLPLAELPEALTKKTIEKGSKDNTAIIAAPIKPNNQPISYGMFDGHNGEIISTALANELLPTLNKKAQELIEAKKKQKEKKIQDLLSKLDTKTLISFNKNNETYRHENDYIKNILRAIAAKNTATIEDFQNNFVKHFEQILNTSPLCDLIDKEEIVVSVALMKSLEKTLQQIPREKLSEDETQKLNFISDFIHCINGDTFVLQNSQVKQSLAEYLIQEAKNIFLSKELPESCNVKKSYQNFINDLLLELKTKKRITSDFYKATNAEQITSIAKDLLNKQFNISKTNNIKNTSTEGIEKNKTAEFPKTFPQAFFEAKINGYKFKSFSVFGLSGLEQLDLKSTLKL